MQGPLDGYRVIDVTSMISGPLATMHLGDQGADIIKIEPPSQGDLVRALGAKRSGVSATFLTVNRNKRSVIIDLKNRKGLEILYRLVESADVFVQNFRPGTAERLKIGEQHLRRIRENLIYVSISGFGETGPYASKRVYDPIIQALSGLADIQRDRDTGRPKMVRLIVPDKLTAMTAAQAITAALVSRERTGKGQHVRLSMLDAMIAFLWPEGMSGHTFRGEGVEGERITLAQDLIFETKDGFITAGTVSDSEWDGLVRALEEPKWTNDERFCTPEGRVAHAEARIQLMAKAFVKYSSEELLARLEAESVPCAPVLKRSEIYHHPQVEENELVVESTHPTAGPIREARPAARFDQTPSSIRRPAPSLGQHTDEVLSALGITPEELADLRQEGAIY